MLVQLHIENFALIDKLTLSFGPGLNVLTGETGAGKSIIIDAVKIALGGRASVDFIRAGKEKAMVELVFDTQKVPEANQILAQYGIEAEEDQTLLINREFNRGGKSSCRLNGRMVPLSIYREVGQLFIDIHGQHDHHSLLQPAKHLGLVDKLGGSDLQQILAEVTQTYQSIQEKRRDLEDLGGDGRDQARKLDILRFQITEIEQAGLRSGEDEELKAERNLLQNAEKLAVAAQVAYSLLKEGARGGEGALDLLSQALAQVKELAAVDWNLRPLLEAMEEALYIIEDKTDEIRNYGENLEFNPQRLEDIESRLALLKKLENKYGSNIDEVLAFRTKTILELADIESREVRIKALEEELFDLEAEYRSKGDHLSVKRKEVAGILVNGVIKELAYLGMASTSFEIDFETSVSLSRQGLDKVEFLFSPNPGEPLKPLAKIASGGELSRVMLALKTILAAIDGVPTLIFDEVDAGIGGQAAKAVAEKLRGISEISQLLCVTHSAQIASFAHHHYFICKEIAGERTLTTVVALNPEQRVQELARMLSGTSSDIALEHAKEMINIAGKIS